MLALETLLDLGPASDSGHFHFLDLWVTSSTSKKRSIQRSSLIVLRNGNHLCPQRTLRRFYCGSMQELAGTKLVFASLSSVCTTECFMLVL